MKLINYITALISGVTLTSCLGDPENVITQDLSPYTFVYVVDNQTNQLSSISDAATFVMKTELNSNKVDISIDNLKLPDGRYISLTVPSQTATITDQGATHLQIPYFTSVSNGYTYNVSDFNMDYYIRYFNGQNFSLLVCNYTVDSRYSVRVVYTPAYYWGATQVVDSEGKVFNNTSMSSFYGMSFDINTGKGKLALVGAKFAEEMPAMNMVFPDIPYTLNQMGFSFKTDAVTPLINNVPFPSYKITDLEITGYYGSPVIVKFTCTIDTEKVKGVYKVSASLDVLPIVTNN